MNTNLWYLDIQTIHVYPSTKVVGDIVLLMVAETMDVKHVEVALQYCLGTTAIYRSSMGGHNPWRTGYKSSDNCLARLELLP